MNTVARKAWKFHERDINKLNLVTKKHKCDMSAAVKQTFAENVSRPACQEEPGINFTWELGTTLKKPRLYEHPPHTGWYIHNAYCPFAIQRSEASKAINIWAFTKLEKYKDSTSPSMVVLVMHCPLLWLFETWWNILILKSYLNLIIWHQNSTSSWSIHYLWSFHIFHQY